MIGKTKLPGPGRGSGAPGSSRPSAVRTILLIGVAALALWSARAGSAEAQSGAKSGPKPATAAPPVVDDGLGPKDVYLEADTLVDDKAKKTVTAEGHVQMRYQGRTLRADAVAYNTVSGVAHAVGHVVVINPDGTQEFSRDLVLDDQFRSAVALGFSGRMEDNVTMVAGAAIKRTETVTELNHGLYTPCAVCKKDGKTPKKPTWSIEATRIIEDRDRRIIYYRNAVIRVLGVPVFYSPVFWHPDPSAERQSGLLSPKITYSSNRGLSYSQPYYLDLGPSADLTVTPQINTRVNPFLNLRFREEFYSGLLDVRVGYTYEENFDTHRLFGTDTSRSYILAKGAFAIDPNWTLGFGAERVTDPTLFQRYTIPQVYTDRGPFPTDTDRLISQIYANRQDNRSYFSIAALNYESLRAAVLDNGVQPVGVESFDTGASFPTATPVEERFDPNQPFLGGRLRLTGEAVTLTRDNPVVDINDPSGLTVAGPQPYSYHGGPPQTIPPVTTAADPVSSLIYRDSRSLDAEANWQSSITFTSGIRLQPFVDARFDAFSINEGEYLQETGSGAVIAAAPSNDARGLGSIGADVSWPFIKPMFGGSLVVEPLAQLILANRLKFNPAIPNEDSVSFEFDETNLFELNKFSGYDLEESGPRANLGFRATLDLPDDRSASFLIGRTYRTDPDPAFTPQSGLAGDKSDWVTYASVTPLKGFSMFNRARLDGQDWTVHYEEVGANFGYNRLGGSIRFVYEQSGIVQVDCTPTQITEVDGVTECPSPFGGALVPEGSSVIGAVENMDVHGSWFFLPNWGVTVNATRDFVGFENNGKYEPVWPIAQFGLTYLDDCLRVDVIYTHEEYYSATIGPSNSIAVRLTLTTLGGILNAPAGPRGGSR